MAQGSTVGGDELGTGVGTDGQMVSAGEILVAEGPEDGSSRGLRLGRGGERGMVSAEWAVGLIAAIAVAGVLIAIVTNGRVERAILDFILMVIEAFAKHLGDA